jgi:starch synthase
VVDADEQPTPDKAATGITFGPVTAENLTAAIRRAHALFRKGDVWPELQHNGMAVDVSWRNRASRYGELYREIVKARRGV